METLKNDLVAETEDRFEFMSGETDFKGLFDWLEEEGYLVVPDRLK